MKISCLSLWQPWASVIFQLDHVGNQLKIDETRHWPCRIRGRVAIHAAKTLKGKQNVPDDWLMPLGLRYDTMPYGCILGTVEIVTCWKTEMVAKHRSEAQLRWGNYAPGRFAFELANPVLLPEPIPYRGLQGFFNVEFP